MAGSDGDILLLAGLEGGGSLSGASGANIKKQLDDIVDALNKSPLKLKVQLDPDSTEDIKKGIEKITKEAKSGSKHLKGILSSSDVGNDGPFGKKAIDSEKAYFENAIRNYQRLSRIESQIDLVNKAKNNWTAAESGNAREYYQNLVQIGEELQAIRNRVNTDGWEVGKLDTGSLEFSLRSIEAIYNTAKERIYALGEATSVENILKEGTTAYKNAIDEIGRLQSKYKNDYIGKWTAADGGASDDAYQGIIAQVEALELLQERVEAGTLSLSQFQKEINNIKTDAKSFVRDIKDAGEAAPADSAEAINNKIRHASEELSRMRGNLNLWTASKDGDTKESYTFYEKQSEELGKYINELKSGGITLAQFNAHFAEIRRNATDAAIAIKEAREARGIDPKMTSDTKEYADSLEKIQKARFDLNSRLNEWSASGIEGSASFESFQGLKDVIGLFDELESKIKGQDVSLKEFQFILSNITNTIGEYERAIVDAGENKRVEKEMVAGSKEYIDSLEKLQKARSEVQKDLDSWTAAGIQGSNSFDDYNGLKNVLLLFDELEQKIKTDGAGLNEFGNLFAYIVNTANEYRRAIDFGEKHSADSAEAISNKARQATTELSRMEKNLERWSAAEVGSSSSSYSSYLNSAADLDTYIAQLKAGEITLGQFNVLLAKVRENAATAAAEIARMGENTGKIEPIKPGSADQQKILDKIRKSIFNLEGDYNLWEAAGLDGAQSQKAYDGLESVIRKLRSLDAELSKSDPTFSFEYAIEQYNKLISKAEEYKRAIKRAGEDHSVEKKMTEDSEEYSESLEKVQKKLHELKKNRDKWSASKTGTSASSFGDLESVIGMLEVLEKNLKNKTLSEFNSELDDLIRKANKASREIEAAGEDHSVEKKMTSDADDTKDYLASLKKVNDEIKSIEANKKKWSAAEDASDTANDYKNMVAQIKDLNDLKTKLEEGKLTLSEFNTEFNKIKLNLSEQTLNIESSKHAMTKAEEAEKFTKQLKEVDAALEQNEKNMREWSRAKTGAGKGSFAGLEGINAELTELRNKLIETGHYVEDFDNLMAKLASSSAKFGGSIKNLNEDSKTLGDSVVGAFQQFGQYIDVMDVVFKGIEWGRQMVEAVTDIDTAMTELRKVTDETDATYSAFLETAATRAQNLGATVVDVVSSSADFARLGHDLGDASALADAALIYKNVGDGIKDIDTASSSIISTMQAFGIEAENAMSIVDSFNAIGKLNCRPVQQCTGEKVAISVKSQGWSRPREDSVINREPVETVIPHAAMYVVSLLPCLFIG